MSREKSEGPNITAEAFGGGRDTTPPWSNSLTISTVYIRKQLTVHHCLYILALQLITHPGPIVQVPLTSRVMLYEEAVNRSQPLLEIV